MDLYCPQCNGTDLKRVSLAYQEGFSRVNTRSRLRAIAVGSDGPDVIVGRATNTGTQQIELSKILSPPQKWSYRKLLRYSVLGFIVGSWVVISLHATMTQSRSVISLPLLVFAALCLIALAALSIAFWKHNHSAYRVEYARWNRSFVCNRCGALSEQNL